MVLRRTCRWAVWRWCKSRYTNSLRLTLIYQLPRRKDRCSHFVHKLRTRLGSAGSPTPQNVARSPNSVRTHLLMHLVYLLPCRSHGAAVHGYLMCWSDRPRMNLARLDDLKIQLFLSSNRTGNCDLIGSRIVAVRARCRPPRGVDIGEDLADVASRVRPPHVQGLERSGSRNPIPVGSWILERPPTSALPALKIVPSPPACRKP